MSAVSGRRPGIGLWRMVAALVRQRRRLLLATVAVALAVGYLAGALTLLDRVSNGLDRLAGAGAERADLVVEGEIAYESALEQTRRLVPATIAPSLETIPGIASVSSRIEDVAIILDADGEPVVAPGLSEQPLGANWPDDDAMSPYSFVGDGRPPEGDDEVVLDERSARLAGVSVGDRVVVVGKSAPAAYEVVGIVSTAEGELPDGASLALFSTAEARELFDAADNDNRVAIRLEPDADVAEVTRQVQALLPGGAEVVDGATGAEHRQVSLTRSFTLVRTLIMGFAGLALVVGMVTVANSLTLLYAERRRTFAALRLVGAKQRQLLTAALVEAAGLAAVASLLGAPLGLLLGRVIEGAVGSLGTSIPLAGSTVSIPALAAAVLIGTVATVLAAIVPAVRACRVSAIEAVAESPSPPKVPVLVRLANGVLVAVGAVALLFGLLSLGDVDPRTAAVIAGAVVVVVAFLAMMPTVLSLAVAAGIRIVPTRPSTLSRIGARDAVRNRARTAATTGALLLATSVVAGLAVFLASFATSIDGNVDELVRSDLVVDSGTFTRGGLPADLLDDLAELPEVTGVSGWQVGRVTAAGVPLRVTGVDGASLPEVLDPGWVPGSEPGLSPQGIALDRATAEEMGVGVGDRLLVTFSSNGVEELVVEGLYTTGALLLGEAMVDRSTLVRQVPKSVDLAALVALGDDTPAARAAVEEVAGEYGVSAVLDPSEFVDARSELLDGFQRVIQWMLLFTLLQALIGVVNTLLLSVGERRREFGLLRATGASRRQLLQLVLVEGLSFAAIGTALGLGVGVAGAVLAVRALASFGIDQVDVPLAVLGVTALAAMAIGVTAAVVPARWAAAVPPLEAVADAGGGDARRRRPGRSKRRRPVGVRTAPAPVAAAPAGGWAPPFAAPVDDVPIWSAAAPVASAPREGSLLEAAPEPAHAGGAPALFPVASAGPVADRPATPAPAPATAPASAPAPTHAGAGPAAGGSGGAPPLFGGAAGEPTSEPTPSGVESSPAPSLFSRPGSAGRAPEPVPPAPVATPAPGPERAAEPLPPEPGPETAPLAERAPAEPAGDVTSGAAPLFAPRTAGSTELSAEPAAAGPAAAEPATAAPAPAPTPPTPEHPLFAPPAAEHTPPAAEPAPPPPEAPRQQPMSAPQPPPPGAQAATPAAAQQPAPEPAPVPPTTTAPAPEPVAPPPPRPAPPPAAAPPPPAAPAPEPIAPPPAAPAPEPIAPPPAAPAPGPVPPPAPAPPEPRAARRRRRRSRRPAEGWVQDAAAPTAQRSTPAEASPFRPAPSSPVAARRSATTRAGARSGDIDAAAAIRLDDVLARLDPSSVRDAPLALEGLARTLAPDERVDHVVQGWAKGNPCVVARTDRRVVVVLDRFPEPLVESLHPVRTSLTVYGPPGTERVSLAVLDRRRLLEVTGIRDANEARTMSSGGIAAGRSAAGRSADRRGGEPEYF